MGPFTYHRNGKAMAMSYYQLPPSLYSDLGLLHDWVEASVGAADGLSASLHPDRKAPL